MKGPDKPRSPHAQETQECSNKRGKAKSTNNTLRSRDEHTVIALGSVRSGPPMADGKNVSVSRKHGRTKRGKKPEASKNQLKMARVLNDGDVLLGKYEVEGLLAGGGFAQVYLAKDLETGAKCAVKAQGGMEHVRRMKLEMLLYCTLRGRRHIPILHAACPIPSQEGGMALIMELVGRCLADLRRQMPGRKFSPSTLYRSMRQILTALSYIHGVGFLHRDVKPANCCLGLTQYVRFFLLDFGLCRQFTDSAGQIHRARKEAPFRGTLRYASVAGHQKKEFGPCNDLIAFLYSTVELGNGGLPWSQITDKDQIERSKKETTNAQLCQGLSELLPFAEHVMAMDWDTLPNYKVMKELFDKCIPAGITNDHPYDWQTNPCELEMNIRVNEALTTGERVEDPTPKRDTKTAEKVNTT